MVRKKGVAPSFKRRVLLDNVLLCPRSELTVISYVMESVDTVGPWYFVDKTKTPDGNYLKEQPDAPPSTYTRCLVTVSSSFEVHDCTFKGD